MTGDGFMTEIAKPRLFAAADKAFALCGIVGVISDLSQPVAPVASYVLVLSILGLLTVFAIGLFSHQQSQARLTAGFVCGLLAAVSAILILLQAQKPETGERGVLASYVEPIGALQAQILDLQADISEIDRTTRKIDATTTEIDARTRVIDETTRETKEAIGRVKQETSDDPRKELANMGISWGADPFRQMIKEGDIRAVDLFLQGGMKLSGARARAWVLPYYLVDDHFSPEVADLLLRNDAVEPDGLCIDAGKRFDVYFLDERLPHLDKRRDVLRKVCATPDVKKVVQAQIREEEARLEANARVNRNRPEEIEKCIREFKAGNPVNATMEAASRFSIFSVSTLRPPRDTVLAELNTWLLVGGSGDPDAAYNAAVAKGCADANRELDVDRAKLDRLKAVADFLKG